MKKIENIKDINILGKKYKIDFVDKPSDVDIYKRDALWGQIDYWTRTIRIYKDNRTDEDLFETLLHEIIHGIISTLQLQRYINNDEEEELVSLLSIGLADVLFRNDLINIKIEKD